MSEELTARDHELVALGAAIGSNCAPCCEYHIPLARKAGLTDGQIAAALALADRVRQVPARKALDVALSLVGRQDQLANDEVTRSACYQGTPPSGEKACCC
jgi:4-carboxymuconolactone decarboxylase